MYKCLACEKTISPENLKHGVRCPYCGYRVLIKKRAENVKKRVNAV